MKQFGGWFFPDHEQHLLEWMRQTNDIADGRQRYQGKKQLAALSHCKRFTTAIDVGAHIGLWSFYLAKRFQTVHAFEPVAEHRACFRENVDAENLTLHACALGDKDANVSIKTRQTSSGDSCVDGAGNIPMTTLDSFAFDDVAFVKIDTEGFEEAVIRGGLETIKRCRPVIIVEQKGHAASTFGLEETGAVRLLESIGMKSLRPPMSGDWIMGWPNV